MTYQNPQGNLQEYLRNFLRIHDRKRKRKRKTLSQEKPQQIYPLPADFHAVFGTAGNLSRAISTAGKSAG